MLTRDMAPGVLDVEEKTYHACKDRLSNSAIGMFINDRRRFVREYVQKLTPREQWKPHFALGGLFHAMLFEPDTVKSRFAVEPKTYDDLHERLGEECPADWIGKKPNRGSNAYKQWVANMEGSEIVSSDDGDLVKAMAQAVVQHKQAAEILFDPRGLREKTLVWNDEETDEPMRARLDHHFPPDYRPLLTDLKTIEGRREVSPIEHPEILATQCFRYGYHRQLAVYMDGYKAVYGVYPEGYLILVEKREVDPMVVVLRAVFDDAVVSDGRDGTHGGLPVGYRPALRRIQTLRESGDWRHSHQSGINHFVLPEWRARQAASEAELYGFEDVA